MGGVGSGVLPFGWLAVWKACVCGRRKVFVGIGFIPANGLPVGVR